jgi:hypothetical protein
VVFSWVGQGGGNHINPWRTNANGGDANQLTFGKLDTFPVCSADSKCVYYLDQDAEGVVRVPLNGSDKPAIVPSTFVPHAIFASRYVAVSPDVRYLALGDYGIADGQLNCRFGENSSRATRRWTGAARAAS